MVARRIEASAIARDLWARSQIVEARQAEADEAIDSQHMAVKALK